MKIFYLLSITFLLVVLDCKSESVRASLLAVDKITSKIVGYSKENGCGAVTFNIRSPMSQACDLSFSFLPGEYADGSFTSVSIRVNGVLCSSGITASSYGWKNARTYGNKIILNAGDNIVSFISCESDIPIISNLRKYDPFTCFPTFSAPITHSYQSLLVPVTEQYVNIPPVYDDVYPFGYALDLPYYYTPCIALYLEAGDRVSLYAPGSWDYTYGSDASTVDFNVYLFHENPDVFSVSTSSINKAINAWDCDVPETGMYNCLIESSYIGTLGGVTIFINGVLYRHLFVSNISYMSETAYLQSSLPYFYEGYYNMFTTNLRYNSSYNDESSPCIWLKRPDIENGGYVVCAYSNNNTVPSDYNWGNNARVRRFLSSDTIYMVSLSSSSCHYFEPDTCDFYYTRLYNLDSNIIDKFGFPIKSEDAIVSGFVNPDRYNCIAWSAGTVYEQVWPRSDVGTYNIMWYDSLYNNQTVHTKMGTFRRPAGSVKYTRVGATEENSVVDLWGIVYENGDTSYTHASIKGGVGKIHGYDWESKLSSSSPRIFHPRYSLIGNIYGSVVAHYKVAEQTQATLNSMNTEAIIADSKIVLETITLTEAEKRELKGLVMSVGQNVREEFDELFFNWLSVSDTVISSDMWDMKENVEYASLLEFTNSFSGRDVLAFDKFSDGYFRTMLLIQDLAINVGGGRKVLWDSIMDAERDENFVTSQESKVNMYIKRCLSGGSESMYQYGASNLYGNIDYMEVFASAGGIKVSINLDTPSQYSIRVINLNKNMQCAYTPQRMSSEGCYEYVYQLPSGHYVVVCLLNGIPHCKKIMVE